MANPSFSIIVVNYNGGLLVEGCIKSVLRYTSDFELILVDNGSTDGSDQTVAKLYPKAIIRKNVRNLGFAQANNIGIRIASAARIVLLNPDTVVTAKWMENLSSCAGSSDEIAIVTPKLLRPDGVTFDELGHRFEFKTGYTRPIGTGETDRGQCDIEREITSCSFACVLIKKEVFEEVGNLDDKMRLYFEDVDFCIRARIAGWKVVYCPNSLVYHVRGGLTTKRSEGLRRNAIAYRLRIMLKCYSTRNAMTYGTARIVRDLVSVLAGIKNRDLQYSLSYLRSPFWNLANLPIRERKRVQTSRKIADREIVVT